MTEPVRIRVENKPHPNLRKLARAILLLVEHEAAKGGERRKKESAA